MAAFVDTTLAWAGLLYVAVALIGSVIVELRTPRLLEYQRVNQRRAAWHAAQAAREAKASEAARVSIQARARHEWDRDKGE